MQFHRTSAFDNVFEYGNEGDLFYIIIKGLVSIKIPNPTISDWRMHRKRYDDLIEWKTKKFERRKDKAIRERYEEERLYATKKEKEESNFKPTDGSKESIYIMETGRSGNTVDSLEVPPSFKDLNQQGKNAVGNWLNKSFRAIEVNNLNMAYPLKHTENHNHGATLNNSKGINYAVVRNKIGDLVFK